MRKPKNVFTVAEYREFLQRYLQWNERGHPKSDGKLDRELHLKWLEESRAFYHEYAARLPVYLVARCPICGGRAWDSVDTYSLNGLGWWGYGDSEARFHWSDTQDGVLVVKGRFYTRLKPFWCKKSASSALSMLYQRVLTSGSIVGRRLAVFSLAKGRWSSLVKRRSRNES